jgi:hypothetical protein
MKINIKIKKAKPFIISIFAKIKNQNIKKRFTTRLLIHKDFYS